MTCYCKIAKDKTGKGFITHADSKGVVFSRTDVGEDAYIKADGDESAIKFWMDRNGCEAVKEQEFLDLEKQNKKDGITLRIAEIDAEKKRLEGLLAQL